MMTHKFFILFCTLALSATSLQSMRSVFRQALKLAPRFSTTAAMATSVAPQRQNPHHTLTAMRTQNLLTHLGFSTAVATPYQKPLRYTFAMLKPHIAHDLEKSREVLQLIQKCGFKIQQFNFVTITPQIIKDLYGEHIRRSLLEDLVTIHAGFDVVTLLLEADNAVPLWCQFIGDADPIKAYKGTFRYIFGTSIENDVVHGSANPEAALREMKVFFPEAFKTLGLDKYIPRDEAAEPVDDETAKIKTHAELTDY